MLSDDLPRCVGEDEGETAADQTCCGNWTANNRPRVQRSIRAPSFAQFPDQLLGRRACPFAVFSCLHCTQAITIRRRDPGEACMSAGTRVEKTTCGAFASGATRANPASVVSARDADTSRAPCRSIPTGIQSAWLGDLCYQQSNKLVCKKRCMNYPDGYCRSMRGSTPSP
ncbi:hypothetical protein LZ32DRAFT_333872 [Colletotrichum eremochloae]|nr:hypothetical protein LZ32DRAFT_333872 [Colletotrichum eremochloae]